MLGPAEDLERAGHITQIKLVLETNEDLDRLEIELIRLLNDCTCGRDDCQRPTPCVVWSMKQCEDTHSSLATSVLVMGCDGGRVKWDGWKEKEEEEDEESAVKKKRECGRDTFLS